MYKLRREKLMENLPDRSMVVFFSGVAPYCSQDEQYKFVVDKNFYYLTGINKEEMILTITKENDKVTSTMFVLPFDEMYAKWIGGRLTHESVKEISNVDYVEDLSDFEVRVQRYYNVNRSFDSAIYIDAWKHHEDQDDSMAIKFGKKLKEKSPTVNVKDIYPYITKMRMVKDVEEVALIEEANRITTEGVLSMMRNIKDGMLEMEVEGYFDLELKKYGCDRTAFTTIAASGANATVLHYSENNNRVLDGQLLLCDLGATKDLYCADVSRTFPVSGKFSARQKEIYQLVLNVQKIVEETARPGITLYDLNQKVVEYYKEELPKLGLNEDVREYYYHSVSHHLGLDTHDVTIMGQPLEVGNVITNEPGLYIENESIGIRIEDDLLITEDGCRVLTDTPKEIVDIEDIMKKD